MYIYHIGVYISDEHPEDQALFVTERCCFSDLVEGLSSPCPCGLTIKPWALESVMQVSKNNYYCIVELLVMICRKVMCYVCYSLAAVAIGNGGPGRVQKCSVGFTWLIRSRF